MSASLSLEERSDKMSHEQLWFRTTIFRVTPSFLPLVYFLPLSQDSPCSELNKLLVIRYYQTETLTWCLSGVHCLLEAFSDPGFKIASTFPSYFTWLFPLPVLKCILLPFPWFLSKKTAIRSFKVHYSSSLSGKDAFPSNVKVTGSRRASKCKPEMDVSQAQVLPVTQA